MEERGEAMSRSRKCGEAMTLRQQGIEYERRNDRSAMVRNSKEKGKS
jgi:hypothetical protein